LDEPSNEVDSHSFPPYFVIECIGGRNYLPGKSVEYQTCSSSPLLIHNNHGGRLMRYFTVVLSLLILGLLAGCSSISVVSDYDPEVDFSTLKTYKWVEVKASEDALSKAPLVKRRVIDAVNENLASKGYQLITSGEPDFMVVTYAGVKDKVNVTDWGYSYGPYWGPYGSYGRNIDVSYYKEATVFIDIVLNDGNNDRLIWRGAGTGVVEQQRSPEESTETVNHAVEKILRDFPPPTMN